nr:MAG TPA: hypothetical protein [Bacteriophage sp.]
MDYSSNRSSCIQLYLLRLELYNHFCTYLFLAPNIYYNQ